MRSRILFVVPAIMMVAALAPMPFGYYQVLRLVTFAAVALIFPAFWRQGRVGWAISFGIIGLLFNPFLPVFFKREIWSILNICAAGIFLLGLHAAFRKPAAQVDLTQR